MDCKELGLQRDEQAMDEQGTDVPDGGQTSAEETPAPQLQIQDTLHEIEIAPTTSMYRQEAVSVLLTPP